jgi:DNA-binding response OmpR family regulator
VRLLLVEADESLARRLAEDLRRHGFVVDVAGLAASVFGWPVQVDLILLGLNLPDLDGFEVCRRLREYCQVPLIGLSRRETDLDCVLALQAGFDDYVTAPFCPQELAARIDAVLRRVQPRPPDRDTIPRQSVGPRDLIVHGPLVINVRTREVRLGGRQISLTRKEFGLLALVAAEPGRVFAREEIMASVWQDDSSLSSRTIDTHVATLRAKLGARGWIVTVHGVGFRIGGA